MNRTPEEKYNLEVVYDDRDDSLEVNCFRTGNHIMTIEQAVAKHNCPVHPEEDNTEEIIHWFLDNFQHEYDQKVYENLVNLINPLLISHP